MTSVTSRPLSGNGPLQYIYLFIVGYFKALLITLDCMASKSSIIEKAVAESANGLILDILPEFICRG
jgi:hypothetical protein